MDEAEAAAARDEGLIAGFVRRHYSLRGTLRLHRHALGRDLLRAPVNVALSPVFFALRVLALAARLVRLRGVARRLASVRVHLPSDLGRALHAALWHEVVAPRRAAPGGPPTDIEARILADHVALRGAVAEIVATMAVVAVGLAGFSAVTPGVLSLAPVLSDHAAHARAVAAFPLGDWAGGLWYGVLPGARPAWVLPAVVAGLIAALALATTFAGLLADPLQAATGTHHRRLRRLLARLDRAEDGAGLEREHLLARLADIADTGVMLLRMLKP